MRRAAPPLLLLLLATAAASQVTETPTSEDDHTHIANDTIIVDNENGTLVFRDVNGTAIELDGNPEEIVRKKRTFGDIVFRGLADVLGYNVQRKPPQVAFPPPLPPVPGIDTPLAVSVPAVAPAPAPAAAPAPCGQARAAGPPPCRAQKLPAPQPKALPCPKPRAARAKKPKPTPPPPPPPPPPCPQPRANPATPAPCAPPPPPPKQQADNLERITSNLRLNFNFARAPVTAAAQATAAEGDEAAADDEANAQLDDLEQFAPIPILPQAAKLPEDKPRVYVDAFVVRNGVPRRVDAVDAKHLKNGQQAADIEEDYLAYDDDNAQQQVDDDDDYEDVQESRDRQAAVRQFGNAVDQFWQQRGKRRKLAEQRAQNLPENHYRSVHFGDRRLADDYQGESHQSLQGESHQSLQRERPRLNRIPEHDVEDDAEATTTTEDPRRPLKPRVLPPTEHNPNQIDTVTVRVPPIYREKRPRKLHRERPEQPDRDDESEGNAEYGSSEREHRYEHDVDSDDSSLAPRTERPRRKRRRKQSRKTRSAELKAEDEDYYGKKVPISKEEQFYMGLTVPPPTLDADVARHLKPVSSGYFLEDYERLRDDPSQRLRDDPSQRIRDDPKHRLRDDPSQRIRDDPSHRIRDDPSHRIRDDPSHRIRDDPKHKIRNNNKSKERSEESERVDDDERSEERERSGERERLVEEDDERSTEDRDRTDEDDRSGELERTDNLSPNARVLETVQQNNYVRATNVQVDDPHPPVVSVKRKTVHIGQDRPAE